MSCDTPDGENIVFQNLERTKFAHKNCQRRDALDNCSHREGRYHDLNPAWSHFGKQIYFSSDRGGGLNIWRMEVLRERRADGDPHLNR